MISSEYLHGLVRELAKLSSETEYVEFKENNEDPDEIGKTISALANSAALRDKAHAYVVWGVRDSDHAIVGTSFAPNQKRIGNEELENWLLRMLSPTIHFQFSACSVNERPVIVLQIARAINRPIQFKNREFIRVGTYTKKLKDHAEKESELWRIFDTTPFEMLTSADELSFDDVLSLLDVESYFGLMEMPFPASRDRIAEALAADRIVLKNESGRWNITNLGAILFATRLSRFPGLGRKAIRVVQYRGSDRIDAIGENEGVKGYAVGFEGLVEFVNSRVPKNEVMGVALRRSVPMYPEIAIRELFANAIIHQDFSITGSGPMVELFESRMEISNPGEPLMGTDRFLDTPPRSRNEALASVMRRIGVCEERGSGIDKVVHQIEMYQLPAPVFEVINKNTRAILFAHRPVSAMAPADRVRACYLHACLRFVSRDYMTNSSLRQRFGVEAKNKSMVSRYIREALDAKVIKLSEPNAPSKLRKYVPIWA